MECTVHINNNKFLNYTNDTPLLIDNDNQVVPVNILANQSENHVRNEFNDILINNCKNVYYNTNKSFSQGNSNVHVKSNCIGIFADNCDNVDYTNGSFSPETTTQDNIIPVINVNKLPDEKVKYRLNDNVLNCDTHNNTEYNYSSHGTTSQSSTTNTIPSYISYYYTNIDQLAVKSTNKMDELKHIINNENPDLLGITEILSKCCKDITPAELKIEGYDCFYSEEKFEREALFFMLNKI